MSTRQENIDIRDLGPTTGTFLYYMTYLRHSYLSKQAITTSTHLGKYQGHLSRRRVKNCGGYLIT